MPATLTNNFADDDAFIYLSRLSSGSTTPNHPPIFRPLFVSSWEEADLTDRLIQALHANELWAGVFIATSTAEHSRAVIGMPKSDLQREIARHLFAEDQRFDLEDNRTIDLLGTSVKNKVNK